MNNSILPSEERPWMKFYEPGAATSAQGPDMGITMWKYIENALRQHGDDIEAFLYFGRKVKRSQLIDNVYRWARTLRGMGIGPDERVVIYSPFTPEIAYIFFALNHIGAWPVMLNMASSPEALMCAAQGARFAVVADAVEDNMAHILHSSNWETVIFVQMGTCMPFPLRQIMALKSCLKRRRLLKENPHYITTARALDRWSSFNGPLETDYDPMRPAIVTSSGGTSQKGYAKQIMDSNAAVIAMFRQVLQTKLKDGYLQGTVCYTSLPPFVSTSLFVLFLAPLFRGMTCVLEPRLDGRVFTDNVLKHRPQVTLIPGRCWIYFFTQIERSIRKGHKPDLSFFKLPIMGGEGVSPNDLRWMNDLLHQCGSTISLISGYGLSEVFSVVSVDLEGAADNDKSPVINVGRPLPAVAAGVFDKDGNELGYDERGELYVKSPTMMLGYYKNEKLTQQVVRDGWFHTGDLCSISKDGLVYHYCRMSDCFTTANGRTVYPIDIELLVNEDPDVRCSMVNNMAPAGMPPRLAAHIVLKHGTDSTEDIIRRIDRKISQSMPDGLSIEGYKIHRHIFRMSNVCKIDRNSYRMEKDGYIRPLDGRMLQVTFD